MIGASSKMAIQTCRRVYKSSTSASIRTFAQKSWVPTDANSLQKITTQALLHEVALQQMESAQVVVPWYLTNMPASYFRQTDLSTRKQHLKAIQAIRDLKQSDLSLKIETKTDDGNTDITVLGSSATKGLLNSQIRDLKVPLKSVLSRVKVFSSLDNQLSLNIFSFYNEDRLLDGTLQATKEDAAHILELVHEIRAGKHGSDPLLSSLNPDHLSDASLDEYLTRINSTYAQTSNPRHFLLQNKLFRQVQRTEGVAVDIQSTAQYDGVPTADATPTNAAWISIAAANVLPEVLLKLSSMLLSARDLDINRAHLDTVRDSSVAVPDLPQTGFVTMLRLLVSPDPSSHSTPYIPQKDFQSILAQDLKRLKWLDEATIQLGVARHPELGILKAEVITGIVSMLQGPLHKVNAQQFSSAKTMLNILETSPHFIQIADSIATLFLERFKPPTGLSEEAFNAQYADIHAKISRLHHESARTLLLKMLDTVKLTLRTNIFNSERYALSFRVHPSVMVNVNNPNTSAMPFGVFFSHGRNFNGFHCRFRDIARGGLRIVTPNTADQFVLEGSRQFDEAYGLSFAQQLKNKDIPEGGAKAVVLVNSPEITPANRVFAVRKAVKAFSDSILDLTVKDGVKNLVDFYGKDELIYLGPDEQVIPYDIDWICDRARVRGYPIPAAFMSSKKGAGINHKEYGVTSEGVVVYLDVALKRVLNIDPRKQPFTIKITGGPDGDVAGNLMKILFREYGSNCKVLGIADGFGSAEDPEGLNSEELLRLVHLSLPITSFDKSKLSPKGVMFDISTEEGLARRLSLPFRIKADAFIPAGGRPNTINGDNWKLFLDETGKPSSPLIVEGANIFTTPEARENLFKHAGVVIVKDSSANKCGVITSSCEVQASMLLSKEEFMSVKKELVDDVVVRLRLLARLEAELLFRAYKNYPGALPHFSERISLAIGKVKDAITDALQNVNPGDALFEELMPLIKESLPKKLADVAWSRVPTHYPVQYQRNAIASALASKLVYQEGIHLVETQPSESVAARAFLYYREHREVEKLTLELQEALGKSSNGLSEETRSKVVDLVKRGGARTSLDIF